MRAAPGGSGPSGTKLDDGRNPPIGRMTLECPEGGRSCMIAGGHRSGGRVPTQAAGERGAAPQSWRRIQAEHGRWLAVRGRVGKAALFIGEVRNVYYT